MNTEEFKRRLTAILSADVEGYSRLMREDEEATIRTLTSYRSALATLIQQYRGRVVDSPGDNLLAEFTSVVDAVNCAVEIQRELAERNAELPEARRMRFRIGVNLGDVVEEGERIYGDGVNIAARMEGLAEGGGICVSGTVYDSIVNKLGLEYEFLGEQEVKNIAEPVRVYRLLSFPGAAAHRVVKAKRAISKTWRNLFVATAAILVVGAAVAVWHFYFRPPPMEVASVEKMAFPLPDKPSIAVLPFVNMSDDPEQEYFSDGITEEIITALSKTPKLFVIARTSSFKYKGKEVDVRTVGRELGVRNVLEGSVRRAGDKVRITAQLVDAKTNKHLWAERYDRDLKDLFALQDEITMKVVTALQVKLTEGEQARLIAKGTNNLDAYLSYLEAREYLNQFTKETTILARQTAEITVSLDPDFAYGYVLLGTTHLYDAWLGSSESPKQSLITATALVHKALQINPSLDEPHRLLAHIYARMRRYDKASAEAEKALDLNPNSAHAHATLGHVLLFAAKPEEAIPMLKKAIRLNPYPPSWYYANLAGAYKVLGHYDEAIQVFKKALEKSPDNLLALVSLTGAYGLAGRWEEARATAKEVLRVNPKFSVDRYVKMSPFKDESDKIQNAEALRKAGLK